jgi:hypothetical protein
MIMNTKIRLSGSMIALAAITLALSSWGLFTLAYRYGGVPVWLALLAVGGLDLFAVASGRHALTVASDGDSPAAWNAIVVVVAIVSATLQFSASRLENHPWPVGLMMAMFPVATILLFEGALRRAHRLEGRRTGRVARPRASFEMMQWIMFPAATMAAFRLGVADRRLGGDAAFKLGLLTVKTKADEAAYVPPARVEVDLPYNELVPGYPNVITSGQAPALSAGSSGTVPDEAPDNRPVTALVAESLQVNGPDMDAIVEDVTRQRPAANPETIRRTVRRLNKLRVSSEYGRAVND